LHVREKVLRDARITHGCARNLLANYESAIARGLRVL
jgi:hypothetical protein